MLISKLSAGEIMKRITAVFIIMVLFSANLFAQQVDKPSVFIYGGPSIPLSPKDFTDTWVIGYNAGLGLDRPLKDNYFLQIAFDFDYHTLSHRDWRNNYRDKDGKPLPGVVSSTNIHYIYSLIGHSSSMVNAQVNLKRKFLDKKKLRPYIIGGVSFLVENRSQLEVFQGEYFYLSVPGKMKFGAGVNTGLGIEFPTDKLYGLFLETRLIKAFIDTKEFVWTIRLGVRVAN